MRPYGSTKHPVASSRAQDHRVTGSAPTSLQPFRNISNSTQGSYTMAPSLKDKGGRLMAFANAPRANEPQAQAEPKPASVEPPKNVAPAPAPATAPAPISRPASYPREVPGLGGRNTAAPRQTHPFGRPHGSPHLSTVSSPNGRAKVNRSDRRQDIFSGSQLDENFMESGLTTPYNEPSEPIKLGPELTRDLQKTIPPHRLPDRNRFQQPAQTSDVFTIGDDLRMNVVSRPQRHNANHMGDGFQDNVTVVHGKANGHYEYGRPRPDSPARHEPKPVREVRIRKSHTGRSEVWDTNQIRNQSPKRREIQWQMDQRNGSSRQPAVHHLDDEDAESLFQEEEHTTPRPTAAKPVVPRSLMESSMPAITNSAPNKSRLDRKRRRPSPEYDDIALNSMSFTALRQQPFDFDPSKEEQKGTGVNPDNVEAKLDQFRHLGEKEQHDLFSNMSMENWETSGEWFVNEFSGIMQRLLEARRHKRAIIQQFEQEAADREEAVRLKTQSIDSKLSKMKQDGQRVVNDKIA